MARMICRQLNFGMDLKNGAIMGNYIEIMIYLHVFQETTNLGIGMENDIEMVIVQHTSITTETNDIIETENNIIHGARQSRISEEFSRRIIFKIDFFFCSNTMMLPIELLKEIALHDYEAYNILACTCKGIVFDRDFIMKHFTKQKENKEDKYYAGLAYRLPNGLLHVVNDTEPTFTVTYDKLQQSYWYYYGVLHRGNDLPAEMTNNSSKKWFQHGLLHRENDLPAIEFNGNKSWFQYGLLHRENDQPAEIRTGLFGDSWQHWYCRGKLHREHGPAIIRSNGVKKYYHHGVEYFPDN